AKEQYLVGLYTNNPLDDLIIDRLCNNDNLFELNNLCGILDNVADHDLIFKTILCSDARCINGIKKLFADHFMEFSDKLVLNTHLEEKPATFNVKKCVIEKAIAVTHKNFEHISRFPFMSLAFLERNKDFMYYDDEENMYHCILLYDIDFGDGIVIESEGSTYTRYAQYIPQAKYIYEQFLDSHLNEIRLCCPIEIYQHIKDNPKDNCILDNADMAGYADDINTFIRENDLPAEHKRGLMLWYSPEGPDDEISEKVQSAHCTVEVINGELTGVITAKITGELSDEEMEKFRQYCVGQLSDGWGKSLEQKYMRTEVGEINISFWSDDEAWALVPEDEYLSDNTQDMEMSM
uniref:DUF6329 domain-containing protein n=1 Tax=Ruminococcus flavefaciens TaxID=1265 RepID=UPI0013DC6BFD